GVDHTHRRALTQIILEICSMNSAQRVAQLLGARAIVAKPDVARHKLILPLGVPTAGLKYLRPLSPLLQEPEQRRPVYPASATWRWSCSRADIVSGGRRPKPHSVAIPKSVITFRAVARRRSAPSSPSVIWTKHKAPFQERVSNSSGVQNRPRR